MLLVGEIDQAAGGRDQNVHAAAHSFGLLALIDPTDHDGMAQRQVAPVTTQAFVALDRQFARRGQNQCARGTGTSSDPVFGQALQKRQAECRSLARTGLCDAKNVAAFERERDGSRLNGGRSVIAFSGERALKRLGQAEGRKCKVTHE